MNLIKFTLLCFLTLFSVNAFGQVDTPQKKRVAEQAGAGSWVLVFDDPRPARLRGWVSNGYGRSASNYQNSPELKRFSKRVASKYKLNLQDEWFIPSLGVYCLVVSFRDGDAKTLQDLKTNKHLLWVQGSNEFDLLKSAPVEATVEKQLATQDDPSFGLDGFGVSVAIVDSSVDTSHQDLIGALHKKHDFAEDVPGEKHGTAIAGVMLSRPEASSFGVPGLAPAAKVYAFRGCWEVGYKGKANCSTLSLARALDAVLSNQVDLLNLSLSGPSDVLLERLLEKIIDQGTMVVAAYDPNRSSDARFPKPRRGVLIVRAEGLDDSDIKGFNTGFTAPGTRVVPIPGNQYDLMSGHSIATAYTTGLLALRKQKQDSNSDSSSADWKDLANKSMAKHLIEELGPSGSVTN